MSTKQPSGRGFVVVLSVVCTVLLLSTLGFGVAVLLLSAQSPAVAEPSAAASATAVPQNASMQEEVQGRAFEIIADPGIEFGGFVMAAGADGDVGVVHALITNTTEAYRDVSFDVTSYSEDGRIIARYPTSQLLLPGQQAVFQGFIPAEMDEVTRIAVEQTRNSDEDASVSGSIVLEDLTVIDGATVEATLTSTLDTAVDQADVWIVGTTGGEIFVVGNTIVDIPAGGEFTARAKLYLATSGDPDEYDEIPADAEYEAYFEARTE